MKCVLPIQTGMWMLDQCGLLVVLRQMSKKLFVLVDHILNHPYLNIQFHEV